MTRVRDPSQQALYDIFRAFLAQTSSAITNAGQLEEALTAAIITIREAAADAAYSWNARRDRVWGRLPVEMRAACFEELDPADRKAMLQTSRHWRHSARATPELWTRIRYPSALAHNAAQLRDVLQLSRSCSLDITLDSDRFRDEGALAELSKHRDRIRSLVSIEYSRPVGLRAFPGFSLFFSAPLLRLKRLHLYGCGHLEAASAPISAGIFPQLRYLHIPRTPVGQRDLPIATLRDLRCRLDLDADATQLFYVYPALERLSISAAMMKTTDRMPQGPPPASLRHFELTVSTRIPNLAAFFGPWCGQRQLKSVTLRPLLEGTAAAALFASICDGPWALEVPTRGGEHVIKVLFNSIDSDTRFKASISGGVETIIDCVPHFTTLATLEVPSFVIVALAEDGTVTLPAVTEITVSRPSYREDHYEVDEEDDDASIARLLAMVHQSAIIICTPSLRSITFDIGEGCIQSMLSFAVALRSTFDFAAEHLDRLTLCEVDEADAADLDHDGAIRQGLFQIADEIVWGEFDED